VNAFNYADSIKHNSLLFKLLKENKLTEKVIITKLNHLLISVQR